MSLSCCGVCEGVAVFWKEHPFEVRGARGGGFSSGFVYLLAHGARRDWSARHPGPTSVSRMRFRLDCRSGGSHLWRHGNPSTLPSWTHEDTSVHARERDRSPEERRPLRLTAVVMRLHSRQVYLITRRQTWLFQRPSSLTHPLPSGAWWRATLKDGVMMMMMTRVEAADSSHPFYILLKGLFLSFTMTELFIHLRSVCLSGNQNSLLLLRFRGETVEPDTRLLATNGIPPSPLSSSARCCKELSK